MAEKTNANIGFEKQIWDAACVLWGHIPAAEYRKVIVGLIFLRYISCAFDKKYQELVAEGDGFEDDKDAYTMDKDARWNKIAEKQFVGWLYIKRSRCECKYDPLCWRRVHGRYSSTRRSDSEI